MVLLIEIKLPFRLEGHTIQSNNGRGGRPATPEEITMWWQIQDLLATASRGAGEAVQLNERVVSKPDNWCCSICGAGLIPQPGTNRRSFMHACVAQQP